MAYEQGLSNSWKEHINKEFPGLPLRYPQYTTPFRRVRRKDSWTKAFKMSWKPLEDWKLPRKIREVRAGQNKYVAILEASLGGDWVTSRLVPGESFQGTVQKRWRLRPNWDRQAYGKSVHQVFKGWPRYMLEGPEGISFIGYEGEFYRFLGERYSTQAKPEELEEALRQMIEMRFEYGFFNVSPSVFPKKTQWVTKPRTIKAGREKRRQQTQESWRTRKQKQKRLKSLSTLDYIDNGGHLTLSLPPDPETDLAKKEKCWKSQRIKWCKGLERIAKRYGIQVDWFLEVSKRRCKARKSRVETAHYHMFWRRHVKDRFSYHEVRDEFLNSVRNLVMKIWNINSHGLVNQPINNEHHMEYLKGIYLSKVVNGDVEISWGRYYGRVNPADVKVRAILTMEEHFKLRRIQTRANNSHLPNIAVDVSGPLKSSLLLQTLEALGIEHKFHGAPLVVNNLVTEVSHTIPDTLFQRSSKHMSSSSGSSALYNRESLKTGDLKKMKTKNSIVNCGFHVIGRDKIKLPKEGPLFRQIDVVPDLNRIDLGGFSIDVGDVEEWAVVHQMAPRLNKEDLLALSEAIRRSRRVLMPVFIDQDGRLLHGAESILAVAEIQLSDDPVQVETIPAIYLHVDDQAAEAELVLALNMERMGRGAQRDKNEQRRLAVRTILLAGHDGTDRLIAGLCGLKDSTVVKSIRLALESDSLIERREEFVDRRGGFQRRVEGYDSFDVCSSDNSVSKVSAPDTIATQAKALEENTHGHEGDAKADRFKSQDSCEFSLLLIKWHQTYGDRPVWPEELTDIARECAVAVPKEPGCTGKFCWKVYSKPDGSDYVLTLQLLG